DTVPQRDLMDAISRIIKGKPKLSDTLVLPAEPQIALSILPAISASPSVGLLVGVSGNAVTRFGPAPETSLSTISASVNYTTKKQFNVLLRSNVFTSGNQWKFEGDWRYLDTNQPTYGLGEIQPSALESPMDFRLIRFYETVYWETTEGLLVGPGYHLNYYFDIEDHNAEPGVTTPFLVYNNGRRVTETLSSGISLNLLSETRDNPINATAGHYARLSLRMFPTWLGSDDDWQSIEAEGRIYPRLLGGVRSNLALWGLAWLTFGKPPYLDLPAIGWDYNNRSGRGFAQGRIRSSDMLYAEAEYRITLSRDGFWGAVAFLNLTSTTDPELNRWESPDAGWGLGLRVKLNKHSRSNITIDLGFGAEGSAGVFLGTGEAF
ncbi:MAG TPA: BamA/TamA family outer membrane protein, partial [Gemmatimonadales bacterium]|nr:BamA/TamA family outer membrane protein [Gemmatimonadales bacterium]